MRLSLWTGVSAACFFLALQGCSGDPPGGGGTDSEGSGGLMTTTLLPPPGTSSTGEPTGGSSTTGPVEAVSTGTGETSTGEPTPTTGESTTSTSEPALETTSTSTTSTSLDQTTGETDTLGDECQAPGLLIVCDDGPDVDPFHAIGVGCPGAPENTIPIANKQFNSKALAYRAATGFGTAEDPMAPGELLFRPREGDKFLIISTGRVAEPDAQGRVVELTSQFENDNNFNDDEPNALPAPMSHLVGSNDGEGGSPFAGCDGKHDCSDSIAPNWALGNGDPNDLFFASFDVTVPGGVKRFLFDMVYFSSEYPAYVGDKFNDMFIGWSTSEAYTGNVTFFEGQPLTVTALGVAMQTAGYTADAPELAGTGFEGFGSTGWLTVDQQVVPGETFTFAFAIMDMGDSSKATAAVIDHWRWDCKGCVPIEVNPSCGTEGEPKCCGLCVEAALDPNCDMEGHPKCCSPG